MNDALTQRLIDAVRALQPCLPPAVLDHLQLDDQAARDEGWRHLERLWFSGAVLIDRDLMLRVA